MQKYFKSFDNLSPTSFLCGGGDSYHQCSGRRATDGQRTDNNVHTIMHIYGNF